MRFRRYWVVLVLAAGMTMAAGSQSRADDYKGWFIGLDLAGTQPDSLDQRYANNVDSANNRVNRLVLDNDADFTGQLSAGYSWGKLGALKVSFWGFDNQDEASGVVGGGLYPTIFGYGQIYGGQYLYNAFPPGVTFRATGEVKAGTFDLDYSRPMAGGEKMTVNWLVGLRSAAYEETQTFTGDDTYVVYQQDKHFKAKGFGPRFGIGVNYGFTDLFSINAGATFSLLQATTEGDASQSCPTCPYSESLSVEENNLRGSMLDLDLRGMWEWQHFGMSVGYAFSQWEGIVTDPFSGNDGDPGIGPTYPRGRDSIAFNSLVVGLKWKFGGGS